jgi:aspartyl-tRNA(Asn)/glutamyl-tRNA(Gln) amidotransferase subunit B
VSKEQIEAVKSEMPVLPKELFEKYTKELKLSEYDASILISLKPFALYYEELIKCTKNYKAAANWMIGDVKSYLNQQGKEIEEFPIEPKALADLIELIDAGKLSTSVASSRLFPVFLVRHDESPLKLAEELNLIQDSDEDEIKAIISDVIKQHVNEAERYKNGEKQLVGFFMGQLMKASKGKADPKVANKLMRELLEQ